MKKVTLTVEIVTDEHDDLDWVIDALSENLEGKEQVWYIETKEVVNDFDVDA